MRQGKLLLASALFISVMVFGDSNTVPSTPCLSSPTKIELKKIDNSAFFVGEKCFYDLKYQFIKSGEASLEVKSGPVVNCRPTYQFISNAKSAKFIDNFFMVRDYNSSLVDRESLATLSFHQNLKEGHFRIIRNTVVDYVKGTYSYDRHYKGKDSQRDGEMLEAAGDILSSFFATRTLPLELGKEYKVRVFSIPDTYDLKVKVQPKIEKITVPAGTFDCIRIEPDVKGDAIFKVGGDGGMSIWLTADNRKLPVLIRSRVTLGAFDAELREFDTPPSDMVNE